MSKLFNFYEAIKTTCIFMILGDKIEYQHGWILYGQLHLEHEL